MGTKKCRDEPDSPSSNSTALNLLVKHNVPFFKCGLNLSLEMPSINNGPIISLVSAEQNRQAVGSSPTTSSKRGVHCKHAHRMFQRYRKQADCRGGGCCQAFSKDSSPSSCVSNGQKAKWKRRQALCSFPSLIYYTFLLGIEVCSFFPPKSLFYFSISVVRLF